MIFMEMAISDEEIDMSSFFERGSGDVVSEARDVSSFNRVILAGIGNLILQPDLKKKGGGEIIRAKKKDGNDECAGRRSLAECV